MFYCWVQVQAGSYCAYRCFCHTLNACRAVSVNPPPPLKKTKPFEHCILRDACRPFRHGDYELPSVGHRDSDCVRSGWGGEFVLSVCACLCVSTSVCGLGGTPLLSFTFPLSAPVPHSRPIDQLLRPTTVTLCCPFLIGLWKL